MFLLKLRGLQHADISVISGEYIQRVVGSPMARCFLFRCLDNQNVTWSETRRPDRLTPGVSR